jgi:hypothetical protein
MNKSGRINSANRVNGVARNGGFLWYLNFTPELLAKFLLIWAGKYSDDNLSSELDSSVIVCTGKDFLTQHIPESSEATFALTDNATNIAADSSDHFWFDSEGTLQQKIFADLIASSTQRTFIKYTDFEPYNVSMIGILKEEAVLTEDDKVLLTRIFKLWTQYWGEVLMEQGYMKDNRVLTE